jgi:prolipoprotein diacylglyceryltransferase
MYPTLYHAFLDLFGVNWSWAKMLNSFGFFVAIAFITASYTLSRELKRKQGLGQFQTSVKKMTIGGAPDWMEVFTNALIGFIVGWKILFLLLNSSRLFAHGSPQEHIFSKEGYPLIGILLAAAFGYWRYYEFKKQQLPTPEVKSITVYAYEHTGTITFIAAIFGIIGAKLFHLFENPKEFIEFFSHPDLQSFISGLTVFGGLIVAAIAVLIYAKRNNIHLLHLCDAATPGIILAYGIGRIGCQVSGDGDWGINNTAPQPSWLSFLPDWVWAYDYPNNVNGVGVPLTDGVIFPGYGTHLPVPVFPTPLYETAMCIVLFGILWFLRKRIKTAGLITALYLMFNGIERFLIESIRVNNVGSYLGIKATQAQFISVCFFLAGIALFIFFSKKAKNQVA